MCFKNTAKTGKGVDGHAPAARGLEAQAAHPGRPEQKGRSKEVRLPEIAPAGVRNIPLRRDAKNQLDTPKKEILYHGRFY